MINTNIKIFLVLFFTCFTFVSNVNSAMNPTPGVSDISECTYKVQGYKVDGTTFSTGWKSSVIKTCNKTIDFSALGVPDGIFNLHFASKDSTIAPGPNVMGDHVKGEYKVDTKAPKCILNSITLEGIENQYYNNGIIYYKGNVVGGTPSGKIKLDITCRDTEVANFGKTCGGGKSCVSGITSNYKLPTILGANPNVSLGALDGGELDNFTLTYNWSGAHNNIFDILNNNGDFVSDYAGNTSKLTYDSNTKLFVDYGTSIVTIPGITKLELRPDNGLPNLGDISYNSGNDGTGGNIAIGSTNKYFAALGSRNLIFPIITDNDSGLRGFSVSIEKYNDKNNSLTTSFNGSALNNGRIVEITEKTVPHNFSDVSQYNDYHSDGYRNYSWEVETVTQDGNSKKDVICDMVNNCRTIFTPDLRVVANAPSLSDSIHDISNKYTNNRSNYFDEYDLNISFKDKYNNEVVPVNGVKNISIVNNLINTLGTNQLLSPNSGDGVGFTFRDGNSGIISFNNSNNTSFTTTLSKKHDLDKGKLNIKIKSAVPTYNEYVTSLTNPGEKNKSMFGPYLTAELKYEKLTIDVDSTVGYAGVGEFVSSTSTNPDSFVGILPDITFDPVVSYNSIGNIYPLVEGQFKNMPISNEVLDLNKLSKFSLDISLGTNNDFIKITESKLKSGNVASGNWNNTFKVNNYKIIDKFQPFALTNGKMDYNGLDVLEVLPQTIGGINNTNSKIALYSELTYTTNGVEVKLPGIQTGFKNYGVHDNIDFSSNSNYNDDSSVVFSEIQISGITQTNNDGTTNQTGATTTNVADTKFDDFSKITLFDLKTHINRNLSLTLKGSDLSQGTKGIAGIPLTISNLTSFDSNLGLLLKGGNILYIKDRDVVLDCGIDCSVSGKKTLIIENGNLTINSDMYYSDNNSVLGIVLVGNESNGNTSQVKINENITNGVGILYSEGPVVSINNTGVTYNGINVGDNLNNQLHWKGSFITRNTVGGSIKDIDSNSSCPYGTPEYKSTSCTQEIAQGYDLIYLRRYARVDEDTYYGTSIDPMGDGKVPLHYDVKNVKIAGGITVTPNASGMDSGNSNLQTAPNSYNAPLIIDYDTKIQLDPPYIFEQ